MCNVLGCTAVREIAVYRQHGGLIEAPLKPLNHHSRMVPRGLRKIALTRKVQNFNMNTVIFIEKKIFEEFEFMNLIYFNYK